MAIVKSGASSDQWTIDPTSKAGRMTPYDSAGNNRGVKTTYRATSSATFAAAAGTAPFFAVVGSATKTVIIQRVVISGLSLTAVAYHHLIATKTSTAVSGGTSSDLTQTPLDSNSAAGSLSVCKTYTAAPTAGSVVGVVASRRVLSQASTPAAAGIPPVLEFDFRTQGSENSGVYLRGTSQGLEFSFSGAPASAVSMAVEVEWTEE